MGLTDEDLIELLKVIRKETKGLIAEIGVIGEEVEVEVGAQDATGGEWYICGKADGKWSIKDHFGQGTQADRKKVGEHLANRVGALFHHASH